MQKVAFLHTNNKCPEKGNSHMHNYLKKYLGTNLTKEVEELYNENFETLKKR